MILLPIADNAMKHGPSAGHRGELVLRFREERGALAVELSNPGVYTGPREGGSGLPIVEKRLALAYGDRASFQIRGVGDRTSVTMRLPERKETTR
jgi:LytS/YehU family sensor histidine kinase